MSTFAIGGSSAALQDSFPAHGVVPRISPLGVLALAIWCGLVAGLLEAAANVIATQTGRDAILRLPRHFVWIIPLANLILFTALGVLLALVTRFWRNLGSRLSLRLLGALALLPALLLLFPRIYGIALFLVGLAIATRAAALIERNRARFLGFFRWSFAVLAVVAAALPIWLFAGNYLAIRNESARPLPAPGSPNVLLIVLDTVRADHLSLYGYSRRTTPNLDRLARQGIRFDAARSTAAWTLPSHASMFTGRWPRELGMNLFVPLDKSYPTLADFLSSRGYATGGFVANLDYCSWGTGLGRGFTRYEDHVLSIKRFRIAKLVNLSFESAVSMARVARDYFGLDLLAPAARLVFGTPRETSVEFERPANSTGVSRTQAGLSPYLNVSQFADNRKAKDASYVNRQFLHWLATVTATRRPFFAFLNYFDAHASYILPEGFGWHFGERPKSKEDYQLIVDWNSLDKSRISDREVALGRDCYDNCIAYLDDQLGKLFAELTTRGVVDETLIIITSDHGESLGEHGLFGHPRSLYQTEIHVPLLIIPPKRSRTAAVVAEFVTLRDLPSSVLDLLGLSSGSPFPGRSLGRFWNASSESVAVEQSGLVFSEESRASPWTNPDQVHSPLARGPMVSLAEGEHVYIRNEGSHTEELYDLRHDPKEERNLAAVRVMQTTLERMRRRLASEIVSTRCNPP
jgi:arylsulfatase A-like enzyme